MDQHIPIPTIDVKKYGGTQVAIFNGEVIAAGQTLKEVIAKVRAQTSSRPLTEIKIFAVPKSLSVIYYVADIPVRHYPARKRKARAVSCR